MTVGSGIAVAGIWAGVAAAAWADPIMGFLIACCAMLATMIIAATGHPET